MFVILKVSNRATQEYANRIFYIHKFFYCLWRSNSVLTFGAVWPSQDNSLSTKLLKVSMSLQLSSCHSKANSLDICLGFKPSMVWVRQDYLLLEHISACPKWFKDLKDQLIDDKKDKEAVSWKVTYVASCWLTPVHANTCLSHLLSLLTVQEFHSLKQCAQSQGMIGNSSTPRVFKVQQAPESSGKLDKHGSLSSNPSKNICV